MKTPVPMYDWPHSKKVLKCFPVFRWNLMCSNLHPLPLVLSVHSTHHGEESCSLVFSDSHHVFTDVSKVLLTLLFPRLNSHSSLSFCSYKRGSCALIIFVSLRGTCSAKSISAFYWGAQNWTPNSRGGLTRAEQRGRTTPLDFLATL